MVENDLPRHVGLGYEAEVTSDSIDSAVEQATRSAETVAFMLAATGRAPVGKVLRQVAYEIIAGAGERDFRQWFWDPPMPIGKVNVKVRMFLEAPEPHR